MKVLLYVLLGVLIGGGGAYLMFCGKSDQEKGFLGFAKFDPTVSGPISYKEAVAMHKMYMLDCWHAGEDTAHTSLRYLRVDKSQLTGLMTDLPDGGSIRIYFGDTRALDQSKILPGILTTFLVGADANGKLLINTSSANPTSRAHNEIIDNLPPCPDNCPNPGDDPAGGDGFN